MSGSFASVRFALALQPARSPASDVFTALRLDVACGVPPPQAANSRVALGGGWSGAHRAASCAAQVHVSPQGDDDGSGTAIEPLRSVVAAVAAVRASRAGGSLAAEGLACIVLTPGVHYLAETVQLDARDSRLLFTADGDVSDMQTWVSGGAALGELHWRPHNVSANGSANIWVATVPSTIPIVRMPALNTLEPLTRLTDSQFPNYDPETGALKGEVQAPWGGGGAVESWHKPALYPRPTVFWKSLAGMKNDSTMDCYNHFSTGSGGPCAHWKGRGADQNYYCGNASDGGWVEVDANMEKSGLMLFPLAMTYNVSFVPNIARWRLPPVAEPGAWALEGNQPSLTVWQGSPGGGGGWYNNRFAIIGHNATTRTLNLSADGVWPAGGWQGGRTWHTLDAPQNKHVGPLIGGNWHVNGVFEELDAAGEYYFNTSTRELFFFYNTSVLPPGVGPLPPNAPPPAELGLVAPFLEVFFNLTAPGGPAAPISDVSFAGLAFRDQRPSMLDDWVIASGGDWALRRAGALLLESTERVSVVDCAFVRTDGNAISINGYNRNASILDSSFQWLGMSAVALLGDADQDDGTAAFQPWGTVVAGNTFSELGIVEKQSSALFVGKSALTRFEANVAFNMPRAAVNFNDALGGGHNVTANAIFNTCRESGDHGPLNSWNRMAMASRVATGGGEATYAAAMTEVSRNMIDAGYGGSQAFDNDDGSAFIHTHDNFFVNSDGFKMDYGGHDSASHDNVIVVREYDGQACINAGNYVPGHEQRVYNNTCVLPPAGSNGKDPDLVAPNIGSDPDPCGGTPHGSGALIAYDNRYYTLHDNATTRCGNGTVIRVVDLPPPMEAGSSSHPLPDSATIIAWGREKIFP